MEEDNTIEEEEFEVSYSFIDRIING